MVHFEPADNAHNDTAHNDNAHNDKAHNDKAHNDKAHNDKAHNDKVANGTLAPVTYLPGVVPADAGAAPTAAELDADAAAEREHAEKVLMQRLRGRSLSTSEAYKVLKATDIAPEEADAIIERFAELHYIDEEKLAEQIIHSHHERKGLGRAGVEAEMRRRGLDASVILDKLEELPDDEAERAIELACKRVRQLDRLDDQTIDRRLTGFLMRKGYASNAVRLAVKAALASRSGGGSGVRFR